MHESITKQQYTVLEGLSGRLKTSVELASELSLSRHTINHHRKNAYDRLGINSQEEALLLLLKTWYENKVFDKLSITILTPREVDIVISIIKLPYSWELGIANELNISVQTVLTHIKNIAEKLQYSGKKKKLFIFGRWITQLRKWDNLLLIPSSLPHSSPSPYRLSYR